MIRLDVDRDQADRIVTALYIAAGLIPPPAAPEPGALALANELARSLDRLPARPKETPGG